MHTNKQSVSIHSLVTKEPKFLQGDKKDSDQMAVAQTDFLIFAGHLCQPCWAYLALHNIGI